MTYEINLFNRRHICENNIMNTFVQHPILILLFIGPNMVLNIYLEKYMKYNLKIGFV